MNISRKLRITKAELLDFYPECDAEIFFRDPKNDEEFVNRYLPNKLWRLNNLYTIVDKHGNRIDFIMNYAQHKVYSRSLIHPRLMILKSRQQGISTFWLISFLDDTIFLDDISSGLMSQGKDESSTLLTRTKLAWNELDSAVKYFIHEQVALAKTNPLEQDDVRRSKYLKKDNTDELAFLNNSTIFIRTSFRSATLQRLHISEYGKICNKYPERAKETKTGTLQAIAPGNTVVIESTAEGNNDFKVMWDETEGKDITKLGPKEFQGVFLSWLEDPDCTSPVDRVPTPEQAKYFADAEEELDIIITQEQKNFWIDQYKELGDYIYQEYPMTPREAFQAVRDGSYYGHLFHEYVEKQGRIVSNLLDPNLETEVAIDLGMNDDFVMGFFQYWDNQYRLVHEYRNTGMGIAHYVDYMFALFDEGYHLTNVYVPHDVVVRDLSTGQSRRDRFVELGVKRLVVLPKIPVTTGIEMVRKLIHNLWIDSDCTYTIDCLKNYSKEWDERLQVWKDKPVHDQWSHGADMIRYLAMSRNRGKSTVHQQKSKKRRTKRQVVDGIAF